MKVKSTFWSYLQCIQMKKMMMYTIRRKQLAKTFSILCISRKYNRCAYIKHSILIWLRRQHPSNIYATLLLHTEHSINIEKMVLTWKNLLHTNTMSLTLKGILYLNLQQCYTLLPQYDIYVYCQKMDTW